MCVSVCIWKYYNTTACGQTQGGTGKINIFLGQCLELVGLIEWSVITLYNVLVWLMGTVGHCLLMYVDKNNVHCTKNTHTHNTHIHKP